jgi:hypothetical protein
MKHVAVCDEQTIDAIARGLKASALGKQVSFRFDEGMNKHHEGGEVIEVPNGTATLRIYINGGAVDKDVPMPEMAVAP